MSNIENLRDLFVEQGRELYDASRQEQEELPAIRNQVHDETLRNIIDNQLKTAREQHEILRSALENLKEKPEGEKNECCSSIFKQTHNLINRSTDPNVRDAAVVNAIQRLNHNKITGLGSLASYARVIGQKEAANAIHETLIEEKTIDAELSALAESELNKKAAPDLVL